MGMDQRNRRRWCVSARHVTPSRYLGSMKQHPNTQHIPRDLSELPRPGAMTVEEGRWVPTVDGESLSFAEFAWDGEYNYFTTREEAWTEAIRWVKVKAGLSFVIELEDQSGCLVYPRPPLLVETVAEAREAILRFAIEMASEDQERHPSPLLRERGGEGPTWEDLARLEYYRRYDPRDPDARMSCSYSLYQQGGLEGVGGVMWTYVIEVTATGPPEVWDHPADRPCGLDPYEE